MRSALWLVVVALVVLGCSSGPVDAVASAPVSHVEREGALMPSPLARQFGGFRRRPHPIVDLALGPVGPTPPSVPAPDLSTYLQGLSWFTGTVSPDPSLIVQGGDLDIAGTFRATVDSKSAPSFDALLATSSEGVLGLHYVAADPTNLATTSTTGDPSASWHLKVRGVDVLDNAPHFAARGPNLQWRAGDDVTWRAWYRPSTGAAGIRITVNGVTAPDVTASTTGGALAAPTSVSSTGCPFADPTQWQTFIARHVGQVPNALQPEIVVIGDSTVGSEYIQALSGPNAGQVSNLISVALDVYTVAERATRPGIGLLAVAGDTTLGQAIKFDSSPWHDVSFVQAVIIQVGINDRGSSAASVSGAIQVLLVNDIHSRNPTAKVLIAKITPYAAYDGTYAYMNELNADIMGTGPNPITGVDARISAHYTELDDGTGTYKPAYNFDVIHENNAGRAVVANAYRAALQGLGVLP